MSTMVKYLLIISSKIKLFRMFMSMFIKMEKEIKNCGEAEKDQWNYNYFKFFRKICNPPDLLEVEAS